MVSRPRKPEDLTLISATRDRSLTKMILGGGPHPPRPLVGENAGTVCPPGRVTVSALGFSSILGDPRVISTTHPPRIRWGSDRKGQEGDEDEGGREGRRSSGDNVEVERKAR